MPLTTEVVRGGPDRTGPTGDRHGRAGAERSAAGLEARLGLAVRTIAGALAVTGRLGEDALVTG